MPTLDHIQRDRHTVSVHREIALEVKIQNVIHSLRTLSEIEDIPTDILIDAGMLIWKIETYIAQRHMEAD